MTTEIFLEEISLKCAPRSSSESLIITTNPTQFDITRAKMEHKMVLVFVKYPERVARLVYDSDASLATKSVAIEMWSDGLMQGWGVPTSSRLMLMAVGRDLDIEEVIAAYQRAWDNRGEAGQIPRIQSLGIANMVTEDTLKAWRGVVPAPREVP